MPGTMETESNQNTLKSKSAAEEIEEEITRLLLKDAAPAEREVLKKNFPLMRFQTSSVKTTFEVWFSKKCETLGLPALDNETKTLVSSLISFAKKPRGQDIKELAESLELIARDTARQGLPLRFEPSQLEELKSNFKNPSSSKNLCFPTDAITVPSYMLYGKPLRRVHNK